MAAIPMFHTPNAYYAYDANHDEIVNLSRPDYDYLRFRNDTDKLSIPSEQMQELLGAGYFADHLVVEEVIHPYTDFLRLLLDRKVGTMTLQLTQGCNFRCKYCVYSEEVNKGQRTHSTKAMTWETAKDAVDFLYDHSVDAEEINIGFYGGEPLLEFGLIQKLVDYCKMRFFGKVLNFNITSNGTLLTEEMVRYFEAEGIRLMISLDGPKDINDRNRVFADGRGTYDTVMEKIRMINRVSPDYAKNMALSMVIDPMNDFDCINEITVDYNEMQFATLNAALVDKDYDMESPEFSEEYSSKYEYQMFLAILAYFGRYPKENVSPISYQGIVALLNEMARNGEGSPLRPIDAPGGPCIPGKLRMFCNVDGDLFPCERVSETSPTMKIGSIYTGFNVEQAKELLNVGALSEKACKDCWSFRYCTTCAKKADVGADTLSLKQKVSHCNSVRNSAYSKLRNMICMQEIPVYYNKQIWRDQS